MCKHLLRTAICSVCRLSLVYTCVELLRINSKLFHFKLEITARDCVPFYTSIDNALLK